MPGPGGATGHATVVDKVDMAEAFDPESFARLRSKSLESGASERISLSAQNLNHIAQRLTTNLTHGLSTPEAEARLQEDGPNLLAKTKAKPFWHILYEQINILNMLVVAAGVLCLVQGTFTLPGMDEKFGEEPDIQNAVILFTIVTLCMVVGAYMEWSCSRIMADVSAMSAPTCQVIRDGIQQQVDSADIVRGDVLVLGLGDVIAADARVITVTDLLTNEMPLTGEPHDITKTVEPEDPTAPFPSNMLYATTNVVNGGGRALVLKTGMATEMGKIAEHLKGEEVGLTSVQKTMNAIGRLVTLAMLVLVAGIFCISYFGRVDDPADPCDHKDDTACFLQKSILRCLFNAVGAIPETLQPAAMFLLVMGCKQMMKVNAQTRKLAAVDTLGSCSFICSDKTGTLTEGKMTCMCFLPRVRKLEEKIFAFYPTRGFDPAGGIFAVDELTETAKVQLDAKARGDEYSAGGLPTNFGDPKGESVEALLVHATMLGLSLNSYGTKLLEETRGVFTVQGNMSEGALVVAAAKAGLRGDAAHSTYPRDSDMEVPFSSSRKMMATVHKLTNDSKFEALSFPGCTHFAIVKGAPDKLLPHLGRILMPQTDIASGKCKGYVVDENRPFDTDDKAWFLEKNEDLSSQALRVLAVAIVGLTTERLEKMTAVATSDARMDEILASNPALLGILGLMDPPRESAKDAVAKCHKAGIRVAMITGDQKPTAMAIAKDLGIIGPWVGQDGMDSVATECSILATVQDNQKALDDLCSKIVVWARAQPSDKVTIVESLQRQQHAVAMTGDGVNDAGALKKADIGVAMGIAGTDVAKGAADMILMDDRFATIVDAVAEGRRIFSNIQKMVAYLLCVNIYEVIVIMAAMIFKWAVPLEEEQLFKANFITHEFYPWCMVMEAAGFFNMMQPPRSRQKTLIPRLTRNVLMVFVFFAYCTLLLTAQALGSYMYCGTVLIDNMMGATSTTEFYAPESRFICLHAYSLSEKKKDEGKWKKDRAPLICSLESFSFGGYMKVEEFGRSGKEPEQDAMPKMMDTFSGVWKDDYFGLDNSFLKDSFQGGNRNITRSDWESSNGWLTKCTVTEEGELEKAAEGDNLCWKRCDKADDGNATNGTEAEDVECWKNALGVAEDDADEEGDGENDDDDDDDDDDDVDFKKPTLYAKFNCKGWGVRKMRAVFLLTMVLMEFTMLYAFSKYEFGPPLVFANMSFPIAWGPMLIGVLTFVYFPVSVWDNEFAPLDAAGVLVAVFLTVTFYAGFELMKVLNRQWFAEELLSKMAVSQLSAEGKLSAYAGVRQARAEHPSRVPLIRQPEMEVELQAS